MKKLGFSLFLALIASCTNDTSLRVFGDAGEPEASPAAANDANVIKPSHKAFDDTYADTLRAALDDAGEPEASPPVLDDAEIDEASPLQSNDASEIEASPPSPGDAGEPEASPLQPDDATEPIDGCDITGTWQLRIAQYSTWCFATDNPITMDLRGVAPQCELSGDIDFEIPDTGVGSFKGTLHYSLTFEPDSESANGKATATGVITNGGLDIGTCTTELQLVGTKDA